MQALPTGLLLLALGAVPGSFLADLLVPERAVFERRTLAAIAGVSLLTIVAYLCAMAGALLAAPWVLGAMALALGALRYRRWRWYPAEAHPYRLGAGPTLAAALAIAATLAAFAAPLLLRPVPQGWDPAFHSAIIDGIQGSGALPTTWGPYEPGEKFNYPAALHAAIALYARLSGVAPDLAFTHAFLLLGALMLLSLFALGVVFAGGTRGGVLAVLVYGFGDAWGTLTGHAGWGGLPNLVGLVLMSGFVLAVSGCLRSAEAWGFGRLRGSVLLGALFAAAAAFTHHLSFALLGFSFAVLLALEVVAERRVSPVGRAAFWALTLAVLTAGVLVLVRPSGRFDLAHAFKFERERITDLLKAWEVMGPLLLLGGGSGLVLSLFTHREDDRRVLPAWTLGLLSFWVLWDMVYRAAVWWIAHGQWTALTPSRGLTDAAVPLAVCAALLVERGLQAVRLPRLVPWAIVLLLGLGLGRMAWPAVRERVATAASGRESFAEARALCATVRTQTPPDAVLFAPNAGEVGIWLPYLCRRELNYFPDPGYYQSPYREAKMRLQDPAEFLRLIQTSHPGRPVFQATRGGSPFPLVTRIGGWNLHRLDAAPAERPTP